MMLTSLKMRFERQRVLMSVTLLCGLIVICTLYIRHGSRRGVERLSTHYPMYKVKRGEDKLTVMSNTTNMMTTSGTFDTGSVLCNDTRLMPKGTFPPIALASYPGSGNTWVRHLIETSTGYATGSVYSSSILKKQGFIGEKERAMSGKALTIKTHKYDGSMEGVILLVRNPYRAMIAEYNRRKADKTSHAKEEQFETLEWRKFVRKEANRWIKLNQDYISTCHHSGKSTCKSILVVYYEQLQVQLIQELRRILGYLSLKVDQERLACVLTNAEGAFHRPKRNQTFDPFSEEDKRLVDSYMETYCDMIDKAGLENPPLSFTSNSGSF